MEPWRAKLDESDSGAAWDLFIEQYRRLIFAAIKQLARDHDDILDVFARVCEALRAKHCVRTTLRACGSTRNPTDNALASPPGW